MNYDIISLLIIVKSVHMYIPISSIPKEPLQCGFNLGLWYQILSRVLRLGLHIPDFIPHHQRSGRKANTHYH